VTSVYKSTIDNGVKFTNLEIGYMGHHLSGSAWPVGEFVGNSTILACLQITGNKYILNVIDLFSRYAWSVVLKDKTGTSITRALKPLFQNRKPITKQSDKGTEFVNSIVQQYLNVRELVFIRLTIPT